MTRAKNNLLAALGLVLASSCVNDPASLVCPSGLRGCGGECVDTELDPSHCGECDQRCADGELCSIGLCGTECLGGTRQCGTRCVDTQNDPAHCGQCDVSCPSGMCAAASCVGVCDVGLVACSGECVDVTSDPNHCSGCDQPCGPGATCVASACEYSASCLEILTRAPGATSGAHTIDVDGAGALSPFQVHCDMTTDGGGWALVLNLDTSDGHVMWWSNPLWTDAAVHGNANAALGSDHKGEAWSRLGGATEILLLIHQEGVVRGWKRFNKVDGSTMQTHLEGGDNTLIGTAVVAEDTANLWQSERLVRLSTQLFANHCVVVGGSCTSGAAGSPDGDRIGSHEASPSDNFGGGLGNWSDMNFCCTGQDYGSGKTCNAQAFRTVSEAQAGWSACYGGQGFFGTDTFAPGTDICANTPCSDAAYSSANGIDYDYALYLR